MSRSILHRGPDGDGEWLKDGVGIAHRRLSIIDIGGGAQPFLSENGDLVLSFNGEIYNFRALRTELESQGYRFRTRSDTEVLLRAWDCWGKASLQRIEGMFAFAIWDQRRRELYLARDRVGIKPLFISNSNAAPFLFGSELKALLASGLLQNRSVRPDALVDYLTLGYVPGSKTLLNEVEKVGPGQLVTVSDNGRRISRETYWSVAEQMSRREQRHVDPDEVWDLVTRVVEKQMVADVPVAAFLSGGVDSSSVTAAMAEISDKSVTAYTVAIGSGTFNELEFASDVARHCGVDQQIGRVDQLDPGELQIVPRLYDEPFADSSAIPTAKLCAHAARKHKVALSGDGGDECFLGYRWYESHRRRESLRRRLGSATSRRGAQLALGLLRLAGRWSRTTTGLGTLHSLAKDSIGGYVASQSLSPDLDVRDLLTQKMQDESKSYIATDQFRSAAGDFAHGDVATARLLDFQFYLPGDILTKVDRASMAASLEVRVPLLDEDIVGLALSATPESILRAGQRKGLLKEAARPHLPAGLVDRQKQGFSVPLADWFRGETGTLLQARIDAGMLGDQGILCASSIASELALHRDGRRDRSATLWAALVLTESMNSLLA